MGIMARRRMILDRKKKAQKAVSKPTESASSEVEKPEVTEQKKPVSRKNKGN